ncbi:MAG TPA: ATP-grasp domain-containing protein [Isosphaeraceae bacterium]|nr:ATP-grasp domain-containing protein [Isosphaeraceae bacterium]
MRIGIAFDLAPVDRADDGPDDRFEEFDKPRTIEAIASVLRAEGHEVVLLGDGPDLLRRVLDDPPDFVWNMAEGQGVGRAREARVPAALEMLGIPYSGSDPLTLAVALDKDTAKRLVRSAGIAVPEGCLVLPGAEPDAAVARLGDAVGYPLIVKPALEGSSKGIRSHSLVDDEARAVAVARRLADDYAQPVLVEQFIEGDEVTVGLIGNAPTVECLGVMRVGPKEKGGRFVYSLEIKRDWAHGVEYEAPARLAVEVHERLCTAALQAFEALGCRDLARIDFRIRDGAPHFLEANPLPGLAPAWSDLVILARGYGIDHPDLIRTILRTALARVGLAGPRRGGVRR